MIKLNLHQFWKFWYVVDGFLRNFDNKCNDYGNNEELHFRIFRQISYVIFNYKDVIWLDNFTENIKISS